MALKKIKEVKGFNAEYWKITDLKLDLMTATLSCQLSLFKDKPTREEGLSNMMENKRFRWTIPEEFNNVAQMSVLEMVAFVYTKIKEPKPEPIMGDDFKYVYEEDGETLVTQETNWFADAVDILEIPNGE